MGNPQDDFLDGAPLSPWTQCLIECRDRFGPPPREFDAATKRMLLVNPPWITKLHFRDALARLVQNSTLRRLFGTGVVVWGHVIQANGDLYSPAPSEESHTFDRPGEVVFSFIDRDLVTPTQLAHTASELAGLRNLDGLGSELQPWADYLSAETIRVVGKEVPSRLSPGARCMVSTTLFRRSHLPYGILCQPLLPLVVATEPPHFAMPLPRQYWPKQLVKWWASRG